MFGFKEFLTFTMKSHIELHKKTETNAANMLFLYMSSQRLTIFEVHGKVAPVKHIIQQRIVLDVYV